MAVLLTFLLMIAKDRRKLDKEANGKWANSHSHFWEESERTLLSYHKSTDNRQPRDERGK